jgi:trans-aconitate 2-methyltransferase
MTADEHHDVVFSNAALHWVPDHAALCPRLLARVRAGGVLAVQVPANMDGPAHRIMRDTASSDKWRSRFPSAGVREWFVHEVDFYDLLAGIAGRINLWQTTYFHVMPEVAAISDWYRTTGLRPFLDSLRTDAEREDFVGNYTDALCSQYKPQADGRVLFPFRRLFLVAAK